MASTMYCNPRLMRPRSVGYNVTEYVDTETELGDFILHPGFKKTLESYYKRAGPTDQAKCLELITSLKLGKKIRKGAAPRLARPKSTMSLSTGYDGTAHAYLTTYKREHCPQEPRKTVYEPEFSTYGAGLGDVRVACVPKLPNSNYTEEFCAKDQVPALPIRSGSSTGTRNNNPQPNQKFITWRYPRCQGHRVPLPDVCPEEADERVREITRRNFETVYQRDYIAAPQGFQLKTAFLPDQKDWSKQPYGMDSLQRQSYMEPKQEPILQVPTTRYASNRKKHIPASGTVPLTFKPVNDIFNRTTYDTVYNETSDIVRRRIRDIAHNLSGNTLRQYYQAATGSEKEIIGKMLGEFNETVATPQPPTSRPPTRPGTRSSTRSGTRSPTTPENYEPSQPIDAVTVDSPFAI